MQNQQLTRITTCTEVLFSHVHVFEKHSISKGAQPGDEAYSTIILWPKNNQQLTQQIVNAIGAAAELGKATMRSWGGQIPSIRSLIRDGDTDPLAQNQGDTFRGHYFLTTKNKKTPPVVVDGNLNKIINPAEFFSGCFGFAAISFFPYEKMGKGISTAIDGIQKTREGQRLDFQRSAESMFTPGQGLPVQNNFMPNGQANFAPVHAPQAYSQGAPNYPGAQPNAAVQPAYPQGAAPGFQGNMLPNANIPANASTMAQPLPGGPQQVPYGAPQSYPVQGQDGQFRMQQGPQPWEAAPSQTDYGPATQPQAIPAAYVPNNAAPATPAPFPGVSAPTGMMQPPAGFNFSGIPGDNDIPY